MENFGLIIYRYSFEFVQILFNFYSNCDFYREEELLKDDNAPAELRDQSIISIIAHESAHLWFGDIVTLKW